MGMGIGMIAARFSTPKAVTEDEKSDCYYVMLFDLGVGGRGLSGWISIQNVQSRWSYGKEGDRNLGI